MADASILTVGCTSNHGGKIITGDPTMKIDGKPVARVGDLHSCPQFYPTTPPTPHNVTPIIKTAKIASRGMINLREFAYEGDTTGCGSKLLKCGTNASGTVLLVGAGLALLGVGILLAMKHNKSSNSNNTPADSNQQNNTSSEAIQDRINGINDFINRNLTTADIQKAQEIKDSTCSCNDITKKS